jgi:hypothetical protein
MNNNDHWPIAYRSDCLPPFLTLGAGPRRNEDILTGEQPDSFLEADAVLFPVGAVLRLVPFELHQM